MSNLIKIACIRIINVPQSFWSRKNVITMRNNKLFNVVKFEKHSLSCLTINQWSQDKTWNFTCLQKIEEYFLVCIYRRWVDLKDDMYLK